MARAAKFYYDQLKCSPKAISYLKERGVSGEIARRFGLGYAPDGGHTLRSAFDDYDSPELQVVGPGHQA
jgi:DNA primase